MALLDLGEDGYYGIIQFDNVHDLLEIINKEILEWQSSRFLEEDNMFGEVSLNQFMNWNNLKLLVSKFEETLEIDVSIVYNFVSMVFSRVDFVSSRSEFAKIFLSENINKIKNIPAKLSDGMRQDIFDKIDIALMVIISTYQFSSNISKSYNNIIKEMLEISDSIPKLKKDVDIAISDTGNSINEARNFKILVEEELRKELFLGQSKLSNTRDTYLESIENKGKAFERSIEEYQSVLDAATNKLILERPTKWWMRQVADHARRAQRRAILAFIVGCVTLVTTPSAAIYAHRIALTEMGTELHGLPSLIFASITGLICMTFGVWATRVALRSYLTEEHLKNDSLNRVSITDTFIKLQAASVGLNDEDRKILLQSIMRPVQDGIVQDDGLPQGHLSSLLVELIHPSKKDK